MVFDCLLTRCLEIFQGYETMYRTGDYGRIVNGLLYYEGRADSQIKVRGHRIDLTEINAVLNQLDQVSKGVVLCYKPGEAEQVKGNGS
jgi:acyl-coenzyme A synthetase/AMP-(fatty) acid ligase